METHEGKLDRSDLPPPVIEDVLAAETRRLSLRVLAEAGQPVAVDDLAREILARQRDCDPETIDRADRRQLRDRLYETDLPKLTATGVVAFDSLLGSVELRAPAIADRAAPDE